MTRQRKLRFGLGAALLAAAAITSASASAQTVLCSASSQYGRQLARLSVSGRDPSTCIREFLGIPADPSVPDCWTAAKINGLTCVLPTGAVNIVDLPR